MFNLVHLPDSGRRIRNWRRRITGLAVLTSILTTAAPAAAQAALDKPAEPTDPRPVFDARPKPEEQPPPRPLRPEDKRPGPEERREAETRVVGGNAATAHEYPYFVSVQQAGGGTGDHFCGGSLMSTTIVVTAAHCVKALTAANLQVTVGGTTLAGGDVGVVRDVSDIAVHPVFDQATAQNDVAVLTLATPITRDDQFAQWLRLAQGNEAGLVDPGDPATVIGHGSTPPPSLSNNLLEVGVPIQSDAVMSASYGSSFFPGTMLGAGPLAGGKGFCHGDGGGPLVITSTPQDIQIGDVSMAAGCAQPNKPGIYGELYQGGMANFVNGHVVRPGNDKFISATALPGNTGAIDGDNTNATLDTGETGAVETTVWYSWTPSVSGNAQITVGQHGFDSQVRVYTGSSVSGLAHVAVNDDAPGTLQSEVEFDAVAGTTYRVQVDGYQFDYGGFRLSYGVNRPANDDLEDAEVVAGPVSATILGANARATAQAGEPAPVNGAADSSVWYRWTAPESGPAAFTTARSDFDTTLAVFTGPASPSPPQLVLVAKDDDENGTHQSWASFTATAGTEYWVQVGGYEGEQGAVRLQFTVNPQAHDRFMNGQTISGAGGVVAGSNSRAIGEPGEPKAHPGTAPDTTVWFRWKAPANGTYRFTTVGSTFDTVLSSSAGTWIGGLTTLASDDDTAAPQSLIEFAATANTEYHIQIDGWAVARGNVQLNWSQV